MLKHLKIGTNVDIKLMYVIAYRCAHPEFVAKTGECLAHFCCSKCSNPDHIRVATNAENVLDMLKDGPVCRSKLDEIKQQMEKYVPNVATDGQYIMSLWKSYRRFSYSLFKIMELFFNLRNVSQTKKRGNTIGGNSSSLDMTQVRKRMIGNIYWNRFAKYTCLAI